MLRPLATCIHRSCLKGVLSNVLRSPGSKIIETNMLSRGMCTGEKGSIDPFGRKRTKPMLDFKEDLQDDDGPLGRVMTEERMREQVANSLDIQVLHRLQTTVSESKDIPRVPISLEFTALSRIHSRLALNLLSASEWKKADGCAAINNDEVRGEELQAVDIPNAMESVEVLEGTGSEISIAKGVPTAAATFFMQRLHLKVSSKEFLEFSPGCSLPAKAMRKRIEELKSIGALTGNIDDPHGMFASSVVKKRRKKMNKHKYKKRQKRDRGYSV